MTFDEVKNLIIVLGVISGVIFTIYFQYRLKQTDAMNKKSDVNDKLTTVQLELITTYETQLQILKSRNMEDKEEIAAWTNKYSQLQATLTEKEKSVTMLTQIAQNRNPELENYIKEGLEVNKQILNYLKTVTSGVKMTSKILEDHSMYEVNA